MTPLVSLRGLTYTFAGSDHPALRDVTMQIMPGEFIVITGPSGCGKSTLALAMGGYLFHQYNGVMEGKVRIGSHDPQETSIYNLTDVVGVVQQNPEAQFCTLRVEDELAFGLENHRLSRQEMDKRIDWALDVVDTPHLRDRELATLSGGEQQRVAVASILINEPHVLILDEPTSNLDPRGTVEILDMLNRIRTRTEMALVVIEHKLHALASFNPRMIRMEKGQIVSDGPFELPHLPYSSIQSGHEPQAAKHQGQPIVEAEGLRVTYNGKPVLTDVSLVAHPGEFIAIMGDNGSGKTTLLQSMMGLIHPEQGKVMTLGKDVSQTTISNLARRIGIVFQNPDHQLFAANVWEEAIFAPRNFGCLDDSTAQHTRALIERAGLAGRAGDHPYQLSYGEKRRLNLISILSYDPRLILLDEILIGQDPANAKFLMDLLWDAVDRGSTVLMVNHSPRVTAHYATRLIFLEKGQIVVDTALQQAFQQLKARGHVAYCPPEETLRPNPTSPLTSMPKELPNEATCRV
jgi:energy-coupling factor transport system ATP-binding protein